MLDAEMIAAANDTLSHRQLKEWRRLNDLAYFVLCWGQLETSIDDACRSAIRKRRENPDWTRRRAWDLYNPEDRRLSGLSFEERASLVLDRRGGRDSEWGRLMQYYEMRNSIAHGSLRITGINMDKVIRDFYMIQGRLMT